MTRPGSLKDYTSRVAEVLATLEALEERPQTEVLADVQSSQHDVMRVRAVHDQGMAGTVPLIERTRDLLLSAACAAVETRGAVDA